MVALAGAAAIVFPAYFYVIDPNAAEAARIRSGAAAASMELAARTAELESWNAKAGTDPNAALKEEIASVGAELARLDEESAGALAALVTPEQMVKILGEMLNTPGDIELVAMENLPPEELVSPGAGAGLYRHAVRVTFRGGYAGIMSHLLALENLPHRFLWHAIELRALEYPVSEVTLEVYTLSTDRDFIHA